MSTFYNTVRDDGLLPPKHGFPSELGVGDMVMNMVETIQCLHNMPFQRYRIYRDTIEGAL